VHELIASPFLDDYLVLHPGSTRGLKISHSRYLELRQAARSGDRCPRWLVEAVRRQWELDVASRTVGGAVLVRECSPYGYGRASYELNLGCNYDCEHCYLGLKRFRGLPWPDRERLLHILRDAGVLWLQLTGGEPLIDKLFPEVYGLAHELGMMISISSNGSRLSDPRILELLTSRWPYRLTLSVYGATAEGYDSLTRRHGSFKAFSKGLAAAHEAGLPLSLNLIVARQNAHEVDQMRALAEGLGLPYHVFSNMSPTIYGGAESLPRSRSSTCGSASRSPAATLVTPSSMSIRTAWPASARSAATLRSRSWSRGSRDCAASAGSPTRSCFARTPAPAAA
jgi:uncharacterized Fe-S cluster-containing radical SAM superfamily protein